MFEIEQVFCQRNIKTGIMEWFFDECQGVYGPFSSKERAEKGLEKLHSEGRRYWGGSVKLCLVPIDDGMNAIKASSSCKRGRAG